MYAKSSQKIQSYWKCQMSIGGPHLMSTPKMESIPERFLRRSRLKKTWRRRRRHRHTGHSISSVDLKIPAELKMHNVYKHDLPFWYVFQRDSVLVLRKLCPPVLLDQPPGKTQYLYISATEQLCSNHKG